MKIEFTGRGTEVPPEVRRRAQRKLEKLSRLLPGVARAHVIVTQDKHRHVVEVTVRSPRLQLTAQDEGNELGASVVAVIARLARQAQRRREKRRARKRRAPARARLVRAGGDEAGAQPFSRETRSRGEGSLALRDAATERASVLRRRRDGNLGLIEPEA